MQNLNLDFMLADLTHAKKRARAATANIEDQLQTYFTAIFMKIAADDTERVLGEHPRAHRRRRNDLPPEITWPSKNRIKPPT